MADDQEEINNDTPEDTTSQTPEDTTDQTTLSEESQTEVLPKAKKGYTTLPDGSHGYFEHAKTKTDTEGNDLTLFHVVDSKGNTTDKKYLNEEEVKKAPPKINKSNEEQKSYPSTPQGFAEEALDRVHQSDFDSLTPAQKLGELNKIYASRPWGSRAYDTLKQAASDILMGADPKEAPRAEDLIDPPPVIKANPKTELDQWQANELQKLVRKGISPATLGTQLDEYFKRTKEQATDAFNEENKGIVGKYLGTPFNYVREAVKGAASNITTPVAGLPRLAGFPETADTIQNLPEYLGTPGKDFLYVMKDGVIQQNADGTPMLRSQKNIAQTVGQIGGLFAGGFALKSLGYAGTTIGGLFFTQNALTGANDNFKEVMEKTNDPIKAYGAAAMAVPAATIASVGELAVVSKWANPAIKYLDEFNRAKYLGEVVARNSGVGLISQGLSAYTLELGKAAATGEEVNFENVKQNAAIGAVIPGALAGFHARGVEGLPRPFLPPAVIPKPNQPVTPPAPQFQMGPPDLPALPAPPARLGLPDPGTRVGPDTVKGQPWKAQLRSQGVTKKLEDFQKSEATQLSLSENEANNIPTDFFRVFNLEHTYDGSTVVLTKKQTYIPVDAETVPELSNHIESIQKDLKDSPTPNQIPKIIERRTELKRQQAAQETLSPQDIQERSDLQDKADRNQAEYEKETNTSLKAPLKHEADLAKTNLEEFKNNHLENDEELRKAGAIQTEIDQINRQLTNAQHESYLNDIKAKEANLNQLTKKRAGLIGEARQRLENKSESLLEKGVAGTNPNIEANGNTLVGHNSKWYVVDPNSDVTSVHSYFNEAHEATRPITTKFVTKVESPTDKFKLTPEQEKAARIAGITEEGKQGNRDRVAEEARAQSQAAYEKEFGPAKEGFVNRGEEPLVKGVKPGFNPPKEEKVTKKGRTRKSKTIPSNLSSLNAGDSVELANGDHISKTEEGDIVYAKKPISNSHTLKDRIRTSHPNQPLTSNYSQPVHFNRDSSEKIEYPQILKAVQKIVGGVSKYVKIFHGGYLDKGALAYFDPKHHYLRVGQYGDLVALDHEFGHMIDSALISEWRKNGGVADYSKIPQNVQEALKNMSATYYNFRGTPSQLDLLKEGWSTFFQHYMTGQPTRNEITDWYHNTFSKEHPEVYKGIEQLKDLNYKFLNQTPNAWADAQVARKPNKTLERIKEYWRSTNLMNKWIDDDQGFKLFDETHDLRDAEGNKISVLRIAKADKQRAKGIVKSLIEGEMVDLNGFPTGRQNFTDAISPAKTKEDLLELQRYLVAKHRSAMASKGIETGGFTKEDQDRIYSVEHNADSSPIKRAANNYWNWWTNVLQTVHDASPWGKAVVENIWQNNLKTTGFAHGFYIPTAREGKVGNINSLAAKTGSSKRIISPLSMTEEAASSIISRAVGSRTREAIMNAVDSDGPLNNTGLYIRELKGKERIGAAKEFDKLIPEGANNTDKVLALFGANPAKGVTSENHSIIPMFDGKKVRFFEINKEFHEALSKELPDILNNPLMRYFFRPVASAFRPMATTLNTAFVAKNLVRDTMTAYRYIQAENIPGMDAVNLGKAMIQSLIDSTLYKAGYAPHGYAAFADRLGINASTRYGAAEDVRDLMNKKFGTNFVDTFIHNTVGKLESALSIPEEVTRQAVMRLIAKRMGITDINAKLTPAQTINLIMAYKEGTTNFQNQGSQARVINFAVPFFTARIAEAARLPGDIRRNPGKLAALGAGMLGYGVYHALAHKDDTAYRELPLEAKTSSVWTSMDIGGVQKLIYIPLDDFSQFTFGLGQMIGEKMNEDPKTPAGYMALAKAYFGPHLPLNSVYDLGGPAIKELLQQENNKDYYFDRPIVPQALQYQAKPLQYTEYTSELAKKVGALTGQSPLQIDHAIRSLTPAIANIESFGEKELGYKENKEYSGANWVVSAFARAGSTHNQMDRSRMVFTDALTAARANKAGENPEEKEVRKKLESINKDVSYLNTMVSAPGQTQEMRDKYKDKQRELIRLGIDLSQGAKKLVPPLAEKALAERIRKDKSLELGHSIKERKAAYELSGNTE